MALSVGILCAQEAIPAIEGESLSGRAVSLPAAAAGRSAILIIGFTHASQKQVKEWTARMHDGVPAWSIAVLEDAPRLMRGVITHSIKGSIPQNQHDRFLLVYHGEKAMKQAAGFEQPDDAYVLVIDGAGKIRWRFHGAVTDAAIDQARSHLAG